MSASRTPPGKRHARGPAQHLAQTALEPMGAARVIPTNESRSDGEDLVHHPDGWYWVAEDGRQEIGPFSSRLEAMADRDSADEAIPAEGESLAEVESQLDLATWIDPETGSLADGPSAPHLEDH